MNKHFIEEEDLILDGFRLGVQIFESGFRPTFIVGLWRGGSSVGIVVQECLQTLGVETDHISLRTSYRGLESYRSELDDPARRLRVHGTQYLLESLDAEDALLIVDDVYSSGRSVDAVLARLAERTKRNMPDDVRIAAPWYRPRPGGRRPDYFLHETEDWLVLPYEMTGLSREEIAEHKPYLAAILEGR